MRNDNPVYDKLKQIIANRFSNAVVNTHKRQAEVARCCGIQRQTLQKYIKGLNTIPIEVTITVAEMSNTSVGYLLGEDLVSEPQERSDNE